MRFLPSKLYNAVFIHNTPNMRPNVTRDTCTIAQSYYQVATNANIGIRGRSPIGR